MYVGDHEARATPIADTDGATSLPSSARFAPGAYHLVFAAPGKGITRWTMTVAAGQAVTKYFRVSSNLASSANGGSVIDSSAGSLNAASLIDDTEDSNWAGVNSAARTISRVNVSAMLRPAAASAIDLPVLAADDPGSGARFTALRKFAIEECTSGSASSGATWNRIYTSTNAAFPGAAPRPLARNLNLRTFDVPDTKAAAVRLVALENQCTGNPGVRR